MFCMIFSFIVFIMLELVYALILRKALQMLNLCINPKYKKILFDQGHMTVLSKKYFDSYTYSLSCVKLILEP